MICSVRVVPAGSTSGEQARHALVVDRFDPRRDVRLADLGMVLSQIADQILAANPLAQAIAECRATAEHATQSTAAEPKHLAVVDCRRRRSVLETADERLVTERLEWVQQDGPLRSGQRHLADGQDVEMLARITMPIEGLTGVETDGAERLGDRIELTVRQPIEDVDPLQPFQDPPPPALLTVAQERDRRRRLAQEPTAGVDRPVQSLEHQPADHRTDRQPTELPQLDRRSDDVDRHRRQQRTRPERRQQPEHEVRRLPEPSSQRTEAERRRRHHTDHEGTDDHSHPVMIPRTAIGDRRSNRPRHVRQTSTPSRRGRCDLVVMFAPAGTDSGRNHRVQRGQRSNRRRRHHQ